MDRNCRFGFTALCWLSSVFILKFRVHILRSCRYHKKLSSRSFTRVNSVLSVRSQRTTVSLNLKLSICQELYPRQSIPSPTTTNRLQTHTRTQTKPSVATTPRPSPRLRVHMGCTLPRPIRLERHFISSNHFIHRATSD